MVAEPAHVVGVEPDAVGDREVRAERAEVVEVGRQRLAVPLQPDDRLHLRFGHVAVQPDAVLPGQVGAAPDELVRAVMGDRGRHRRAHPVAVQREAAQRLAQAVEGHLPRREPELVDVGAELRGDDFEQPGDRLVERAVGDHGRHDRAHADLGVGAPHRLEPLGGRHRQLEREIVGGGAALEHHLDRAELRAQVPVLRGAVAADPDRGGEQQLERPAVAHALGEVAVGVRVGVDESGVQEQPARIDQPSLPPGRPAPAGRSRVMVSPVIRRSAGSARRARTSSTRPPRMTVAGAVMTLGRRPGRRQALQQPAEATDPGREPERAIRGPDAGLVRRHHRLAGAPLQLGHRLERAPRRARAEQRVGLGPADPGGERDDVLGVEVVDALVAGRGGPRLALDVEDHEAERLEVGAQPLVVPVGVGRGHRDGPGADGAERLHHRRARRHGGHAGGSPDQVEHLAVPAGAAVEAARRAAVGDDVHPGGGEIPRAGLDLAVHAVHAGRAGGVVGQPEPLAVDGDVARRHQLEVGLEGGVRRGHHDADPLAEAHAQALPDQRVGLVDEADEPQAVVDAGRGRRAALPVVEDVADGRRVERRRRRRRRRLLAGRRDDAQRVVVVEREDRVAPRDLELAVAAVVRHRVAELDRAEHAGRRAQQHRGVVLHRLAERPRAELRPRHLGVLAGEEEEQVEAVRAEVPQAAAAGERGVEHPRRSQAG